MADAALIKVSPDGTFVAIRAPFEDDPNTHVQSWIFASSTGQTGFKTAAQVADWRDITNP